MELYLQEGANMFSAHISAHKKQGVYSNPNGKPMVQRALMPHRPK